MAEDRTRQARASEETVQRRRRQTGEMAKPKRLPIPPEIEAELKAKGLKPRWVNDEGNRMHRFTVQDDYDNVAGVEPVPVGLDPAGQPILAHLLAKPMKFWEEDQNAAEEKRKEVEKALTRSPDAPAEAAGGANPSNPTKRAKGGVYVAPETSIGRGNQIID